MDASLARRARREGGLGADRSTARQQKRAKFR
jgi:hypothetical protein